MALLNLMCETLKFISISNVQRRLNATMFGTVCCRTSDGMHGMHEQHAVNRLIVNSDEKITWVEK